MQGSGSGNVSWNVRRVQRGVRVEGGNRPCRKVWGWNETVDELERLKEETPHLSWRWYPSHEP